MIHLIIIFLIALNVLSTGLSIRKIRKSKWSPGQKKMEYVAMGIDSTLLGVVLLILIALAYI